MVKRFITCNSYRRLGNFHVKNNLRKKNRGVKFSWFIQSAKKFVTVDSYIMNECLEHSLHLIYYLVLGEAAIAGCNAVAVRSSR